MSTSKASQDALPAIARRESDELDELRIQTLGGSPAREVAVRKRCRAYYGAECREHLSAHTSLGTTLFGELHPHGKSNSGIDCEQRSGARYGCHFAFAQSKCALKL